MWFADRTPAVPAPTNLYEVRLHNLYGCPKDRLQIEAHEYGRRGGVDCTNWFVFLKDDRVVYEVAAHRVESIELVEPEAMEMPADFVYPHGRLKGMLDQILDGINYGDRAEEPPAPQPAPIF